MKTCLLHAEPLQFLFNLYGECRTDLLPLFCQLCSALFHALTEPCNHRIQFLYVHIIAFGGGDLCAQRFEARQNSRDAAAIFLLEALDHIHTQLNLVQRGGICVDAL